MSRFPGNKAGAAYGTGYCDAQCPRDIKFINGEANVKGWKDGNGDMGTCCAEMDIWEANNDATAYTPHPCNVFEQTKCTGADCGVGDDRYKAMCDKGEPPVLLPLGYILTGFQTAATSTRSAWATRTFTARARRSTRPSP